MKNKITGIISIAIPFIFFYMYLGIASSFKDVTGVFIITILLVIFILFGVVKINN